MATIIIVESRVIKIGSSIHTQRQAHMYNNTYMHNNTRNIL